LPLFQIPQGGMSNFLQGKTPISFLQELCTKRGITPQYDLVANEGAVHEPSFVFKVSAGEFSGTGKGPCKKKAKHNAALSVLNQMTGLSNGHAEFVEDYSDLPTNVDGQAGNPIGELQEMTQKRLWRPPIYEFEVEQATSRARQFICTVKLGKLTATGTGKSKKLSKRNAAQAMIETVRSGAETPGEYDQQDDYDAGAGGDTGPLSPEALNHYQAVKHGKPVAPLTAAASQKITQFYAQLKVQNGKTLNALPSKLTQTKTMGFSRVLEEVAKEHRFDVSYVDIQERSQSGQCQSLVQLSSMPIAVCYGAGTIFDEARNIAAQAALHYLRIMTKK